MRVAGLAMLLAVVAAPVGAEGGGGVVPKLEPVFEADVLLGESLDIGRTPLGRRNLVRIIGGTFRGPGIRGTVLPGGWDWQLQAAEGCSRLHADYMLRTDDGVIVNVVNRARMCAVPGARPAPIYAQPEFEAPVGRYTWLNAGAYVAEVAGGADPARPSVHIRFYRVG